MEVPGGGAASSPAASDPVRISAPPAAGWRAAKRGGAWEKRARGRGEESEREGWLALSARLKLSCYAKAKGRACCSSSLRACRRSVSVVRVGVGFLLCFLGRAVWRLA